MVDAGNEIGEFSLCWKGDGNKAYSVGAVIHFLEWYTVVFRTSRLGRSTYPELALHRACLIMSFSKQGIVMLSGFSLPL